MNLSGIRGFFADPQVSRWRKLFVLGAVLYAVMPVDAIPDVIPVVGWLDDVGVLSLAAAVVWSDVKRHVSVRAMARPALTR